MTYELNTREQMSQAAARIERELVEFYGIDPSAAGDLAAEQAIAVWGGDNDAIRMAVYGTRN